MTDEGADVRFIANNSLGLLRPQPAVLLTLGFELVFVLLVALVVLPPVVPLVVLPGF